MFRRAAYAIVAVSLLSTAACAPITSYSGFQAIESDPKDVKVGTDTKSTVRGKLGSPSATSTFDPNVWFYMNQVKQRIASADRRSLPATSPLSPSTRKTSRWRA